LSRTAREAQATPESPYWLHPFENYKTFCPYLVGTYGRVADEIARYAAAGYRTIILDVPPDREELDHTGRVLEQVAARLTGTSAA
jgi:alkanesulfonate monooxygenase